MGLMQSDPRTHDAPPPDRVSRIAHRPDPFEDDDDEDDDERPIGDPDEDDDLDDDEDDEDDELSVSDAAAAARLERSGVGAADRSVFR